MKSDSSLLRGSPPPGGSDIIPKGTTPTTSPTASSSQLKEGVRALRRKSLEAPQNTDSVTQQLAPPATRSPSLDDGKPLESSKSPQRRVTSPPAVSPDLRRRASEEGVTASSSGVVNVKISRDKLIASPVPSPKKHFKVPKVKQFKKKKDPGATMPPDPSKRFASTGPFETRAGLLSASPNKSRLSRSAIRAHRKTGDFSACAHAALQMEEDQDQEPASLPVSITVDPADLRTHTETVALDELMSTEFTRSSSADKALGIGIQRRSSVPSSPDSSQEKVQTRAITLEVDDSSSGSWRIVKPLAIPLCEITAEQDVELRRDVSPRYLSSTPILSSPRSVAAESHSLSLSPTIYGPTFAVGGGGETPFSEEDYTNILKDLNAKTNYVFEALRVRKRKNSVKTAIAIDLLEVSV